MRRLGRDADCLDSCSGWLCIDSGTAPVEDDGEHGGCGPSYDDDNERQPGMTMDEIERAGPRVVSRRGIRGEAQYTARQDNEHSGDGRTSNTPHEFASSGLSPERYRPTLPRMRQTILVLTARSKGVNGGLDRHRTGAWGSRAALQKFNYDARPSAGSGERDGRDSGPVGSDAGGPCRRESVVGVAVELVASVFGPLAATAASHRGSTDSHREKVTTVVKNGSREPGQLASSRRGTPGD